jgi:hypothetical protein
MGSKPLPVWRNVQMLHPDARKSKFLALAHHMDQDLLAQAVDACAKECKGELRKWYAEHHELMRPWYHSILKKYEELGGEYVND